MENKELDFLEIKPNKVNNLFILLHGYGSNNEDLLNLGLSFRELLPNTAFISINAPTVCELGTGYQWFSLRTLSLFKILKEIKVSHNLLNNFIDKQLKRFSLTDENLLMAGFSQGAMMTMYTGLRRKSAPLGLMSFSGMVPDTIETLKREIECKPECFLVHGTMDQMVPYNSLEKAEFLLREFDVPYEVHSISDMGHEINYECMVHAGNFIRKICNNSEK